MSAATPSRMYQHHTETVGPVVASAHLAGSGSAMVEELSATIGRHRTAVPSGVGVLLVLHEGAVPPDEAGRSLFLQEVRHPSTKGIAVVILGGGFWAATARSVITFFAVTTRLPVRLFSVDDDPCGWLEARFEPSAGIDGSALRAAARRLGLP